jgi:hypothetical protein
VDVCCTSLYGKIASFRDREKIIRYLLQKE